MWRCNSSGRGSIGNRSGGFRSSCLCDGAQRNHFTQRQSLAQIEPAERDQLFGRALQHAFSGGVGSCGFLIALAA